MEVEEDEEEKIQLSELLSKIKISQTALAALREQVGTAFASTKEQRASVSFSAKHAECERLKQEVFAAEYEMVKEEEAEAADLQALRNTEDLQKSVSACRGLMADIAECEKEHVKAEEDAVRMQFLLEARQLKLLSELQAIYPIEKISGDKEKERYAIRGIELIPPLDGSQRDDEQISSALGYVVHLLLLASKYLEVPLRYQLLFYASRSIIRDPVQKDPKDQSLPLYRKDVEPERFKRAFQWLTKDVEQLLLSRRMKYEKNQGLLANLNKLFMEEMNPQIGR